MNRATQMPLAGISVLLDDTLKGTITDSAGLFRFTGLEVKTYNLAFSGVGYQSQSYYNIVISAGNETNLNIELKPAIASLSEVVIRSGRRTTATAATIESPLSVQRLTTEEIRSNPAATSISAKSFRHWPVKADGSNAIPVRLVNSDASVTPSIGLIVEF